MTYKIPANLYDGRMHRIRTSIGEDFAAKYTALRADGFTVAVQDGSILACKIMAGEPLPTY